MAPFQHPPHGHPHHHGRGGVVMLVLILLAALVVQNDATETTVSSSALSDDDEEETKGGNLDSSSSLPSPPLRRLRVATNDKKDEEPLQPGASDASRELQGSQTSYYSAGGFHVKTNHVHTPPVYTDSSATTASDPPKYEPVLGTVDFEVPNMVQSLLVQLRPDAAPSPTPADDFVDDFLPRKDHFPLHMITLPLSLSMMSGFIGGAPQPSVPETSSPHASPTAAPVATPASPTVAPIAAPPQTCRVVETFSHDARGNPLRAGMLLNDTVPMTFATYAARRAQDNRNGRPFDDGMIFDARIHPSQTRDKDLIQSPAQGNIFIIAKKRILTPSNPVPDDNGSGGFFTATFTAPVTLESITLIDVEEGGAILRFLGGPSRRTFLEQLQVPPGTDGQVRVVPLGGPAQVSKLTIQIRGSGAVDDVVFTRPSTPQLPCPYTP